MQNDIIIRKCIQVIMISRYRGRIFLDIGQRIQILKRGRATVQGH
jgi:hypothetical protein